MAIWCIYAVCLFRDTPRKVGIINKVSTNILLLRFHTLFLVAQKSGRSAVLPHRPHFHATRNTVNYLLVGPNRVGDANLVVSEFDAKMVLALLVRLRGDVLFAL